jgi:hypothetical protein
MIQEVAQTLVAQVQGKTTYTLTVQVGNPADRPDNQSFAFQLTAVGGGELLLFSAPLSTLAGSNGSFVERSASFTVPAGYSDIGKPLKISLYGPATSGPGLQYIAFDDVRLDAAPAPVPEPAAFTLLLSGLSWLLFRRRASNATGTGRADGGA